MNLVIFYISDHGLVMRQETSRLSVMKQSMSVGLVLKPMSFELDISALEERVKQSIESWKHRIEREVSFLVHEQLDLIVSDIVPWVFHVAKQTNIKSVLISNFTWVDIYEEYLNPELVKAYQHCNELSGSKMKNRFVRYDEISLCASEFVIMKAGFGTIVEALLAKKKIAVIERGSIAEERTTVEWLMSHGLALPIQYEKGLNLSQLLKDLEGNLTMERLT